MPTVLFSDYIYRPVVRFDSRTSFSSCLTCMRAVCPCDRPQCDENTTFSNHALYLGLPCCKEDFTSCPSIPSSLIFQRSTKETFWISTQLSSTKLTQNGTASVSLFSPQFRLLWMFLLVDVDVVFQSTSWPCSSGRPTQTGSWTSSAGCGTSAVKR